MACTAIGVTSEEPVLEIQDQFRVPLDELRTAYSSTMRNLFGGPGELANRHGDPEHAAHPGDTTSMAPVAPLADQPPVDVAGPPRSDADPATVDTQAEWPGGLGGPTDVGDADAFDLSDPDAAGDGLADAEPIEIVAVADPIGIASATVNGDEDEDDLTTVRSVTLELTDPITADDEAGRDEDETTVGHPSAGHPSAGHQAAGGPIDPSGPVANQSGQPAMDVDPDENQDPPKLA